MKIRIGNDFRYNWLILWNEEAESFTDATDKRLTVTVYGRVTELMEGTDYTITGHTIAIDFTPAICDKTGSYNLALQYTKPSDKFIDGDRRSAVDVDAFIIVPKSEQSDSLEDITHTSDAVATFLDVAYQKLDEIEAAEAVRETAEEGRVTAETGRVTAEEGRVTAEGLRVTAEQQRAIDSAAAVENANDAATYANEHGAYAEEMSAHPPVIIADYWHNWNFTTNQYESTGQYARGDSAVEGALVVQETGQSAVNTMSQKAVTDELVQLAGDVEQLADNTSVKIKNLVINGDFNSSEGWNTTQQGTIVGGELVITSLGYSPWEQSINASIGDMVYFGGICYTLSGAGMNNTPFIRFVDSNSNTMLTNHTEIPTRVSGIHTVAGGGVLIRMNGAYTGAVDHHFDKLFAINLTETFGKGSEPTKEEFELLLATLGIDYFEGEIIIPAQKIMQLLLESQQQSEDKIKEVDDNLVQLAADLNTKVERKNLLNSDINNFYASNRLNTSPGLVSNVDAPFTHTCKALFLKSGTYSISGAIYRYAGLPRGYYSQTGVVNESNQIVGGTAITFTEITGGFSFELATNSYVFIDFHFNAANTALSSQTQIERGNIVTEYVDYNTMLPGKLDTVNNVSGIYNIPAQNPNAHKKFPKLFEHYLKRDKNIQIILVGDSITARDYHTTYFSEDEKTKRPPLMVSKNIGSAVYDKLTWQNAEYARFNRTGFFTESGGTFGTVVANNTISNGVSNGITAGDGQTGDEWDDTATRPSDTRIYTGTAQAAVQFTIPENTYTFNWIYRTDLKGCIANTVSIAEGNGKVQVYDVATQTWVEANGYIFSMRHPGEQIHRRNTKFQERLRFRCSDKYKGGAFDGRAGSKTITITKDTSDSRFLYWGIEWSLEPYIITVINAARGSQSISSMLRWMDDDVFDFINEAPDTFSFIVHEIYLNQGQNSYGYTKSIAQFLSEWNDYFYSDVNPYSYREQSKIGGVPWKKFEAITWNPNPTAESNGILLTEPYGWHVWESAADGMKTILDNFLCYLYQYKDNFDEEGHSMVNITMALLNEAKMRYGKEWYKAFQSSGVLGGSFYNDVTHPNDYGVNVISRWLNANFDFMLI